MERYEKYKPSGIEWIGEIPEHWEVKRLKYIAEIVLGKMLTNDDKGEFSLKPYLRAANLHWLKVDVSDIKEMWFSQYELEKLLIKRQDILVSEGGEIGRACMWYDELPECYIQNSVHKITIKEGYIPRIFLYQFLIFGIRGFFDSIVNRISIAHLTGDKIKEVCFIVPPICEQLFIATYLDRKTAEIDNIIANKQKLIALYEEEKQAVINHAVTRGVNPNVRLKPSGVEWLGDIPEHWEVKRLKWIMNIKSGDGIKTEDIKPEGPYPIYGGNGIMGYTENYNSDSEDIIIGRVGAKCGNVRLVSGQKWISDNALFANVNLLFVKKYVAVLLESLDLNNMANQNAQPLITGTMIKDKTTIFPPISEQYIIVSYIEQKSNSLDTIIEKCKKQIELLKEYRTTLISEVVTGKVKVSN